MRINIKTSRKHRTPELDLAPDAAQLPWHVEKHGSKGVAVLLLVLAGANVTGAAAVIAFWALGRFPAGLPVGIVMTVGALVLGLLGRHQWVLHDEWTFMPDQVERKKHGVFGRREWTEPLSAYDGVLRRQEYHSGGKNSPSYTLHIVELQHPTDKRRRVRLYCSRSSDGFRAKHEHYAKLFSLPALIKTATGIEERRPEDLDKSVRERVAEGSLPVTFDPEAKPPGSKLAMRVEGNTLLIWTRKGALGKAGKAIPAIFALLGISALGTGPVLGLGLPIVVPIIGAALLAVSLATAALLPRVRQELLLSPEEVRSRWALPWGTFAERSLPAGEVEEVVVQTPSGGHGFTMVQAVGDTGTVSFGFGLKLAEKAWVRDCIIAVISK